MIRSFRQTCFSVSLIYSLTGIAGWEASLDKHNAQAENQPPAVKIISPKNNTSFAYDTPVNYEISVADKEDGNSKYDEINEKEVLLEVRYAASSAKASAILKKGLLPDAPGIAIMRSSNCFNCHNFNSKAMGPSFKEISAKYLPTAANAALLVKHIKEGSTGVWGKDVMPTHPELSAGQIEATVQWILKHAADPGVDYYLGLKGTFNLKAPSTKAKKGVYILTASYLDHGLKDISGKQLKGQDVITISNK